MLLAFFLSVSCLFPYATPQPLTRYNQMLMHLREIIQRPDISALSLMWREGAGPLVDGGALVDPTGSKTATGPVGNASLTPTKTVATGQKKGGAGTDDANSSTSGVSGKGGGLKATGLGGAGTIGNGSEKATGTVAHVGTASKMTDAGAAATSNTGANVGTAGGEGGAVVSSTAAQWTAARKGIDGELALLYLLDIAAFRQLVLRHQHHMGQASQAAAAAALPPTVGRSSMPGVGGSGGGGGGGAPGGINGGFGPSGGVNSGSSNSRNGGSGANGANGGGGGGVKARRMKSVGALHGFGNFVSRKVGGGSRAGGGSGSGGHGNSRKNLANMNDGVDSDGTEGSGKGGGGRRGSGGVGELSVKAVDRLRRAGPGGGVAPQMGQNVSPGVRKGGGRRRESWAGGSAGFDKVGWGRGFKERRVLFRLQTFHNSDKRKVNNGKGRRFLAFGGPMFEFVHGWHRDRDNGVKSLYFFNRRSHFILRRIVVFVCTV